MVRKIWEEKGHINEQPQGKENSQASATKEIREGRSQKNDS